DGMELAPDILKRTGYRLPTEAEWEYACRAGTRTGWSFGEMEALFVHYAWVSRNASWSRHPVGQLKPNELGLFDMHGNVSEWCQDRIKITHLAFPLRGGAFFYEPVNARSAKRYVNRAADRNTGSGFRPARTYR